MRYLGVVLVASCITAASAQGQGGGGAGGAVAGVTGDSTPLTDMLPAKVVAEAAAIFNDTATHKRRGDTRILSGTEIQGDVAVLNGQLTLGGHIHGRLVAINADVILEPTARVDEDILVIGGLVGRRENGRVRGGIRTFRPRMLFTEAGDSIVPDARYTDDGKWWNRFQSDYSLSRSKITLRGDTYNRVEGFPIHIGPSFRRTGEDLQVNVDALGIIRTADRARWDSDNLGHRVDASVRMNRTKGIGLSASLFDVVQPVETWHLSDNEAGLATLLLHRDFRDYYERHGGSLGLLLFRGYERELELTYSHERWSSRDVRSTWTVFRDDQAWRPNPEVNDGKVHVLSANLRVDTRNSETNPWSGWLVNTVVERGQGDLSSPGDRELFAPVTWSRMFMDFRRYNRISPRGQLNVRIVYGARLGDEELPLQRRFSVGGPGSIPGFDFRREHGGTDVGMCSSGGLAEGAPALCERMALLQLEYRGDISLDLFGSDRDDANWRDVGHHPGAQWVVFADAGRGWLLSSDDAPDIDGLTYPSTTVLPRLGTFRTDVGAGLDFGPIGIFAAKAVSQKGVPTNFFVRLRHRF